MSSTSVFDRSGFRPAAAAVLLTVGAAIGAFGTMAAMGTGVARAAGHHVAATTAAPAATGAQPSPNAGFDGVDHSVPSAREAERDVADPVGDSSPTF